MCFKFKFQKQVKHVEHNFSNLFVPDGNDNKWFVLELFCKVDYCIKFNSNYDNVFYNFKVALK